MNRRGFLKLFGRAALVLPPLILAKNLPTELPPNPEAARLEFEQAEKIERKPFHHYSSDELNSLFGRVNTSMTWTTCYASSMVWMGSNGYERGGDL